MPVAIYHNQSKVGRKNFTKQFITFADLCPQLIYLLQSKQCWEENHFISKIIATWAYSKYNKNWYCLLSQLYVRLCYSYSFNVNLKKNIKKAFPNNLSHLLIDAPSYSYLPLSKQCWEENLFI